ncbi:hypothetical protein [Streptomyces boninensis]|uniref:hypothetical protein n=1 Tax=Streptomyces boninensis TaxID=2039455 RepID=UPI003B21C073
MYRAVLPVQEPGQGDGAWYIYKCSGDGVRDALWRPPRWIPDGQLPEDGGPALPSPAELAQAAYEQLRLPSPQIRANPDGEKLVTLPTWLWLSRGSWGKVSATASVPEVSVTAVARPTKATWSTGDGKTVTCRGPGTPYTAAGRDPRSASPDCGHTYRRSSADQPGDAYPVSATVRWTVTWSGAGESGTLPGLTTSASTQFRVAESQALNTR